jgi:hypothetical protein
MIENSRPVEEGIVPDDIGAPLKQFIIGFAHVVNPVSFDSETVKTTSQAWSASESGFKYMLANCEQGAELLRRAVELSNACKQISETCKTARAALELLAPVIDEGKSVVKLASEAAGPNSVEYSGAVAKHEQSIADLKPLENIVQCYNTLRSTSPDVSNSSQVSLLKDEIRSMLLKHVGSQAVAAHWEGVSMIKGVTDLIADGIVVNSWLGGEAVSAQISPSILEAIIGNCVAENSNGDFEKISSKIDGVQQDVDSALTQKVNVMEHTHFDFGDGVVAETHNLAILQIMRACTSLVDMSMPYLTKHLMFVPITGCMV